MESYLEKTHVTIYLGVRINPSSYERIILNSLSLSSSVGELRNLVSLKTNISPYDLELIYCGNVLEDESSVQSCGIRSGVTVHCLKKKEKEAPRPINRINEADILYLASAFKNATKNPNYRSALQRLSRPEVLENIIAATPGLSDDPISVSIIQNPELLMQLCDVNTVRKIVEVHPSLAEAANCIVALIHEEAASLLSTKPSTSLGYSYSLDALSDNEEVDSSQSSDSQSRHGGGENVFASPITHAQLAAALETATGGPGSGTGTGTGTGTAATANHLTNIPGSIITTEMFNHAMQQAFAGISATSDFDAARPRSVMPNYGDLEATSRQLARHLQQMHEIGLIDDTLNLQALQATDWNVQEAINLVFSGAIGDADMDEA